MATAVRVSGLRKEFGSRKKTVLAVNNIGFTLEEGEILAFLGPNGAGKTTTIKMLCGLIEPTDGSIEIKGHRLTENRRSALMNVGAVLEGSRNTYWRLTPAENLEYFAYLRGRASSDLAGRIDRILSCLGLDEKRNTTVQNLSRGMQQKVALGCALVANPTVLLLDEPTLGLDIQSSLAIQQEIRRLATEEKKAILLTTHQMDVARALADRLAIINRGHLVVLDTLQNLQKLFSDSMYEIRLDGHLSPEQEKYFQETFFAQISRDECATILRVKYEEMTAFYDLIQALRPLGLSLLSVRRTEPSLEELFLKIIQKEGNESILTDAQDRD